MRPTLNGHATDWHVVGAALRGCPATLLVNSRRLHAWAAVKPFVLLPHRRAQTVIHMTNAYCMSRLGRPATTQLVRASAEGFVYDSAADLEPVTGGALAEEAVVAWAAARLVRESASELCFAEPLWLGSRINQLHTPARMQALYGHPCYHTHAPFVRMDALIQELVEQPDALEALLQHALRSLDA